VTEGVRPTRQYCPHNGYWISGDAIWCEECFAERLHTREVVALEEANGLKQRELALRQDAEWVEPRPQPRPTYVLPPKQNIERGGMQIEPKRKP